jgi:inhibitor of KinA sporulation pathway (predicted exonuclease)
MDTNQKFLSLDLELNNAQDNSTPNPKIIQVGVAVGNYEMYCNDEIITEKWYLDPHEPIYPFITELTGITDEDIQTKSVTHGVLAEELGKFIKQHNVFVNPVTWGGGDSTELKREFIDRNIPFQFFGRRWIDVKTWHILHLLTNGKRPSGGLRSSLNIHKMKFLGTPHRADDDAFNTLRLFFKLLENQRKLYNIKEITDSL